MCYLTPKNLLKRLLLIVLVLITFSFGRWGQAGYLEVPVETPGDLVDSVDIAWDPTRDEFAVVDKYGRIRIFSWLPEGAIRLRCEPENDIASLQVLSALVYSKDGGNLYIADHHTGEILMFQRTADNQCWQRVSDDTFRTPRLAGVKSLYFNVNNEGQQLVAISDTRQRIVFFNRDSSNGKLHKDQILNLKGVIQLDAVTGRNSGKELLVADYLDNGLVFLERKDRLWRLSERTISLTDTPEGSFQGPASLAFFENLLFIVATRSDALLVYEERNGQWVLDNVFQDIVYGNTNSTSQLKAPTNVLVDHEKRQLIVAAKHGVLFFSITPEKKLQLTGFIERSHYYLTAIAVKHEPSRLISANQLSQIKGFLWEEPSVESTIKTTESMAQTLRSSTPAVLLMVLMAKFLI